ncbi:MAG: cytochrome b/b6 domain-containing protein [Acetobacteraceae bacterium]|jgi:thiosulfate reductase cytochrome b subunit
MTAAMNAAPVDGARATRSVVIRTTHWLNAIAMTCMIGSGWRIYDASPLFPFAFPASLTFGDWLGGALAIHFAAMWLLAVNFAVYLTWSLATGHLRRSFLPIRAAALRADAIQALTFRLTHDPGRYNTVQKLLYLLVILGISGAIVSGAVLWKPVQLQEFAILMGGYEGVRRVHFAAMTWIVLFVVIHVAMVAIVPSTLLPMLTGRGPRRPVEKGG